MKTKFKVIKQSLSSDNINALKKYRPLAKTSILKKRSSLLNRAKHERSASRDSFKRARRVSFREVDEQMSDESEVIKSQPSENPEGSNTPCSDDHISFGKRKEDLAEESEFTSTESISVESPKQVPNATSDDNDILDFIEKTPAVTEVQSSSAESNLVHKNINLPDFIQCEENQCKRNTSFSKIKKMFGNLSTEFYGLPDDLNQSNPAELKDDVGAKPDINAFFSKNSGNDLLRFDFVSSLELKSKDNSSKATSSRKVPYKKGRETILHMKRMTDIISVADFGK